MGVLEVSRWTCFPSGRTDTQTSRGGVQGQAFSLVH